MSDYRSKEQHERLLIAHLLVFGELVTIPGVKQQALQAYINQYVSWEELEEAVALEIAWLKGTTRYVRHVLGLPLVMPEYGDLSRICHAIAENDRRMKAVAVHN